MIADAPAAYDAATQMLDALDRLSAAQAEALAAGDDDRLLVLLGKKQTMLDAADLPALFRTAGPGHAAELSARIEMLLKAEGESLAVAAARRDELAGELTSLGAATAARGAYGDSQPTAAPRRLNVAG